jgi:hypoxanthine phosphoribosyltransferase
MTAKQATAVTLRIKPLFSAEEIAKRVDELASDIVGAGMNDPIVIAILKGSFIFAADLVRALYRKGLAPEIDFLSLGSYGEGTVSQGVIRILRDVESGLQGRNVVLVDDILDSGRTLAFAKELLLQRGAANVLTCVLIDKEIDRVVPVQADLRGFLCPPVFLVGYGMDLAHRYRELPYIGEIVPAD